MDVRQAGRGADVHSRDQYILHFLFTEAQIGHIHLSEKKLSAWRLREVHSLLSHFRETGSIRRIHGENIQTAEFHHN